MWKYDIWPSYKQCTLIWTSNVSNEAQKHAWLCALCVFFSFVPCTWLNNFAFLGLSIFPLILSKIDITFENRLILIFIVIEQSPKEEIWKQPSMDIFFPQFFFLVLARCQTANIILKLQVLFKFSKYFSCIFINILSKFVLSR